MKLIRLLAGASLALAACALHTAHAAEVTVGQVAPLTRRDAGQGRAYAAGMKLAFDVKVTPSKPGSFALGGTLKFAVCTETTCDPKKRAIAIALTAQ